MSWTGSSGTTEEPGAGISWTEHPPEESSGKGRKSEPKLLKLYEFVCF